MKYYISETHLEILMKKYGRPFPNEINYLVILNDSKEFEKNKDLIKDKESYSMEKKICPFFDTANNFSCNADTFLCYRTCKSVV